MSKRSPFVFVVALFAVMCVQSIHGVKVPTLHQQCVNMGFKGVCRTSVNKMSGTMRNRCALNLACAVLVGTKYFKQTGAKPLNGSRCGPNMICHSGRCIPTTTTEITYEGPDLITSCGLIVPIMHQITPKIPPTPEM